MQSIQPVFPAQDILGEGPLWDWVNQRLYWVDIERKGFHCLDVNIGKHEFFRVGVKIGCLGLRQSGGLIMATQSGFAIWQENNPSLEFMGDPEADLPETRFNDGTVDRAGRFWAGSYGRSANFMYRFDPGRKIHQMESGLKIPNGIGFNPDNTRMYLTDSGQKVIFAYDFDLTSGSISNRREWANSRTRTGEPDGLTVDSRGFVWSARWDGWGIDYYSPEGELVRTIPLPVPRPTSVILGGEDFRTLYITSASVNLNPQQIQEAPGSGDLFALQVDVPGLPEPEFLG